MELRQWIEWRSERVVLKFPDPLLSSSYKIQSLWPTVVHISLSYSKEKHREDIIFPLHCPEWSLENENLITSCFNDLWFSGVCNLWPPGKIHLPSCFCKLNFIRTQPRSSFYVCLCLLLCYSGRVEWLQQRSLQSLKYLLSSIYFSKVPMSFFLLFFFFPSEILH